MKRLFGTIQEEGARRGKLAQQSRVPKEHTEAAVRSR